MIKTSHRAPGAGPSHPDGRMEVICNTIHMVSLTYMVLHRRGFQTEDTLLSAHTGNHAPDFTQCWNTGWIKVYLQVVLHIFSGHWLELFLCWFFPASFPTPSLAQGSASKAQVDQQERKTNAPMDMLSVTPPMFWPKDRLHQQNPVFLCQAMSSFLHLHVQFPLE